MSLARRLREALCRYVPPREATEGPHGLFRYPAKYLPQVARALLLETAGEGPVLDPFAGSGTTLVEAARLGVASAGLDLNPLALLLSAVKSRPLDPARLLSAGEEAARRAAGPATEAAPIPRFRNRDYWFPPESLGPLARLRAAIDTEPDAPLRRALLVVFLSIVKLASNASTYHYKLTRSREPDPVTGDGITALFRRRVARAAKSFDGFSPRAPAGVLRGDARRLPFPDGAFSAVVTHPPYSISFDFVRSFKIYLWWLDPGRDTVALDRDMIGNQRRNTGDPPRTGITEIDDLAARVHARDARDGLAVAHFFLDMDRALRECRRVLRPGGALALYMGDSQARWLSIDAPGNLVRLAVRAGFRPECRLPREVPRQASSSIRRIHVEEAIVLRAE